MKLHTYLSKWNLSKVKIKTAFLEAELNFSDKDKKAAWALYIELLTRITTQPLPEDAGDEKTALDSVFSLFKTTRSILTAYGPGCPEFTKISIVVLNQIIRPFTAKWHKLSLGKAFEKAKNRKEFRKELAILQVDLRHYTQLLADMAGVEDLTALEEESP